MASIVKIHRFIISNFFNFGISKPVVVVAGYPDYLSWCDRSREVATVREEWRQGTRLSWRRVVRVNFPTPIDTNFCGKLYKSEMIWPRRLPVQMAVKTGLNVLALTHCTVLGPCGVGISWWWNHSELIWKIVSLKITENFQNCFIQPVAGSQDHKLL